MHINIVFGFDICAFLIQILIDISDIVWEQEAKQFSALKKNRLQFKYVKIKTRVYLVVSILFL